VWHKRTWLSRWLVAAALLEAATWGQTIPTPNAPTWRHIGNQAVDLTLAAPVTGPVDTVWFSPDGSRLYARTRAGGVFESVNFEHWSEAANAPAPADPMGPAVAERMPVANARLVASAASSDRLFALSSNVYRSDDGGRSWTDLTGFRNESIIGSGQHSLAVSPADRDHVVVANDFGVWRSMDGGLSWSGLNQSLPNLAARRILATPNGAAGARILVEGIGPVEWQPGNTAGWQPLDIATLQAEASARRAYSLATGAVVTAFAASGDTVYAGTADGNIFVSFDGMRTPPRKTTAVPYGGAVESLFVDAAEPRVALAAIAGPGARVVRTTNSGNFWDDLSSNLPEGPAHAVTAERAAGAVYLATDAGVFYARADLENANPAPPQWVSLSRTLPRGAARDVKLDSAGNQLYIALDGYGIYAAAAPHRARTVRWVNAADFSTRPAAPGSLLSVMGARVNAARAGTLPFPVLAASEDESQIQVPFEATGPNVALALEAAGGRYIIGVPVQPVSPAIFISRDGAPIMQDADSGLMLDPRTPARSNARIQILATGLGKVRPDWPTGLAAPLEKPPGVVAAVRAYVDRVPVEVTQATLAPGYVGFYLIELQLPAIVNAGPAELYITADGQESNRVQVYLEP
jgi:uncharacterized protein (TIGR03437 family)